MVTELSQTELREKLADGDASELEILDIRDRRAFAEGHIPGAENLPAQQFDRTALEREWPDEVVVSCYVGKASKRVARLLDAHLDADVVSLAGGFESWDGDVVADTTVAN